MTRITRESGADKGGMPEGKARLVGYGQTATGQGALA